MNRVHYSQFTLVGLCGLLLATVVDSPASGADEDAELVVIRAARVITVSGQTFRPGTVVIEGSKVRAVGQKLEYPPTARVIDARRETVMPGLILPRSRYGLRGYSRSGLHGKEKAADEIFLSEIDFEQLLKSGYTIVAYIPNGSGIPGVASVVHTGGRDGPHVITERSYLRVTMTNPGSDKPGLSRALASAKKEIEKVKKARAEWEKKQKEAKEKAAKEKRPAEKGPERPSPEKKPPTPPKKDPETQKAAERKTPAEPAVFKPPKIDPNLEPLVDLLEEKAGASVVFELARASDLRHLDSVLKEVPQVAGSYLLTTRGFSMDYHLVAKELGERKALLMVPPVLGDIPYTANDANVAAELARAGCRLAFVLWRDSESEFQYVRTRVADVVRSGLTRETALSALTLNPARVLGLEDRFGSLEKGKEADVTFLNGDPLGPECRVTRVMIGGEIVWEAP